MEIEQRVNHKVLGNGTITDVYEEGNGKSYFDVHFDKDDNKDYGKYKVMTFKVEDYDNWFER